MFQHQLLLAIIGSGIPLGMLAYWLAVGSSAAFPVAAITEALLSSLALSLGGAALCLVLAVPVGLLVVRYKGRLAIWAERLPYLLHALPGLVIALTLVYFALHYVPVLYQTSGLLLIAYALLFLPLAQAPASRPRLAQLLQAPDHGRARPYLQDDDLRRLHFINALFAHVTGQDLYLAEQIKSAIAFSLTELEAQTTAHPEYAAKFDAAFTAAAITPLWPTMSGLAMLHRMTSCRRARMSSVSRAVSCGRLISGCRS